MNKVINGTSYTADTPEGVINALESARASGTRIRIFYGDTETGKDWGEENHIIGTVGRSTGEHKVPLLINSTRSLKGPAISADDIVKIMIVADRRVVYHHPKYHIADMNIKKFFVPKDQYPYRVYRGGENIANFKTETEANHYILFILGKRMRI